MKLTNLKGNNYLLKVLIALIVTLFFMCISVALLIFVCFMVFKGDAIFFFPPAILIFSCHLTLFFYFLLCAKKIKKGELNHARKKSKN